MIEHRVTQFPIFSRAGKIIGDTFATVFHCHVDPETDDVWVVKIAIEDASGETVLNVNDYEAPGMFTPTETYFLKHHEDEVRERFHEDRAGHRIDQQIARMREPV